MKIVEIISEPSKIYTCDKFKLKVKVDSPYLLQKKFITENNIELITENGENVVTEWGIIDE